ncbi:hypothetical protein BS47DRAFT_1349851 [Hydnum rufescens UP504]|uniref:Uncharacterized protein n=1 Tax=Hydnum rufescens UP504 TaxID=1448309 RepID=A0A9P6AN33_9AGAM|nr:hypothetical protein BS47DRAFT_1349851 [Hydnum rufescens UP504]
MRRDPSSRPVAPRPRYNSFQTHPPPKENPATAYISYGPRTNGAGHDPRRGSGT